MSGTITINTELVVLTSIGMLSTMMEGATKTVAEHMDDIWKLTLPEDWFGPAFEQVAKSIMALVVLSRCLTFHLYILAYVMLLYALITETLISLMILWIFLAAMRSIFLNLISALLGCLLCSFCCTLKASCFEFAVIKGVELACSVYLWLTIGGFYLKLRDNEGQPFQDSSIIRLSYGEPQPRIADDHENRCCDFFVWLTEYGINRYGRDRANLILRILDMSKQEVRDLQDRLRNMMGRGGNVDAEPSRRSVRSVREVAPRDPSSGTAAGSSKNTNISKDACECPEACATVCPDICTEEVCLMKPQSQKKIKKSLSKDSNVIPKAAPKEIQKEESSVENWKKKVPIEESRVDSECVNPVKKEFFKEGYDYSKNINKKSIAKECEDVALTARATQYSRNFDHIAQGTQYSDDFCDKYLEKYQSELKKKPSALKTPKTCVRPFDRNEIVPNPCLDLRPSINNTTSTSRTYDPCVQNPSPRTYDPCVQNPSPRTYDPCVQNQSPRTNDPRSQNPSHGRKTTGRGRTMETVRHHTEDGSIISIKVLVVPVESEKECVRATPRKENVNDVHLCHCIVPAHSTSISCSEAKSGLSNPTDLITPIHSDVPTVKSETSKEDSDAYQAFPVHTDDLKFEPKEADEIKDPKPILKQRKNFAHETPVVTHSSKSGTSFLALAETEEKQKNENRVHSRQVEPKTVYKDKPKTTPGYPYLLTEEKEDPDAAPISKEVSFSKSTQSVLKPKSQEETGEGEKIDFDTQKSNTPRRTISDPGLPTPTEVKPVQYDKLMKPEENVEVKKPSLESIEKWEKVNEDLKRRISDNKEEEERLIKESPPKDPKIEEFRRRVSENKEDGKRLVKESPSFIRDPKFVDFKRRVSEKDDDERLVKESPSFIRDPKTIVRRKKSSVLSRELQAIPENSEMKKVESDATTATSPEERGSNSSLNLLFSSQSDGFKLGPSPTRIKNISEQQKRIAQRRVSLTDEEWLRVYEDFLQGSFSRPENQGDDASDFYAQDLYPSTDSYEKSLIEETKHNKDTKNYTASYALTKYNKSESSYSDLQLVNDLLQDREDDRTFEYWAPLYLDLLSNRHEFSDDTSSFSTVMSSTSTVSKIDRNKWTIKCHEFMQKAKHLQDEICKRFSVESLHTTSDLTLSSGMDDQIECHDVLERKLKEIIEKPDENSQEDSTSN